MTGAKSLRARRFGGSLGLYVHVPFCRTRCRYCDFYRVGENRARMELFLRALHREIACVGLPGPVGPVNSIFLGGGTPSLLTPGQVGSVLAALGDRFVQAADCEVSMEANPSDLDAERLVAFRRAGVNRLSLGVQSFCDRELGLLGRRHDALRAANCVEWARKAGFENLSIDLILGIPGQTAASFRRSVERAIDLATDHVSVYLLEVHPGSEIDGLRRNRPCLFPSEEAQCRRYEWLAERLPAAGLTQYEISNFARHGARCRHNLKYWRCRPFLGFGPSAHSCVGQRRWRRPADLQAYLVDPLAEEAQASDSREEAVFLALRLTDGVALPVLARRLALGVADLSTRLTEMRPHLEVADGRVRFTVSGFLVSNAVLSEMLSWREEVA